MLWAGGGRGGDLYRMGNGLLIFARANCDADRLFHGALLSTANYLLITINSTHVPNTAWPRFDNKSCPQPQPMTKDTVWMPWRKDGGGEAGPRAV